ncbi:MAG: glutaredoxin family protein [Acidobacteriota bacterium]
MIRLRLLSRPGCHLCEQMRADVDRLLESQDHDWEIVDVDSDDELARRWSDSIPVLFVNGRLFAKLRIPKLAPGLRLMRTAAGEEMRKR